jgi:DNA-binding SARP family transcriptional activator/pimeloyl-ACP methyl ester carboxylesterase
MRFRVLGPVEASGPDGTPAALSERQRTLLASLLARHGTVVSVDRLVDLLWGDDPPADAVGALQSQVSRLRRALPYADLRTRPPGYQLTVAADDVDALRFDRLVRSARDGADALARLDEALALWRGPAYAEFADTEVARLEAIRLEEARCGATELWHAEMLREGRAAESLPRLEGFVAEHPLREDARAVLMRTLYALGRHADALLTYDRYAHALAEDLGLEPSAAIQELRVRILRHDLMASVADAPALSALRARYISAPGGRTLAVATLGSGPPLVALPGWVSSIEVIGSGRDPRSSLLQRLVGLATLTLYDRYGTGLSPGPVDDYGLAASVDELEAVVRAVGPPVNVLAMSQAGPLAVALAAHRPALVDRLVLFGTYARADTVFTRPDLNATLVAMVRAHWGLGSHLFASLYRPDATDDAARHLGQVLRDSADREVAANYLAAVYEADVSDLLPRIAAPALVLHYRGDRVVPLIGGRQLALGLPGAQMIPLDGRHHLPDAADLNRVVAAIGEFLSAAPG